MGIGAGTAAIVGGALGAVGSIGGGLLSSSAAKGAAQTQANSANQAAQLQLQQANQTRSTLSPFVSGGADALQALRVALGLSPAGQATAAVPATFNITDPNGNIVVQNAGPDAIAMAHQFPAVAHIVQVSGGTPEVAGQQNPLTAAGLSGLTFQPTQAQLEATPGYQFDLSQGLRGVENSAAAQGRGLSGAALKGAAGFATGLANNTLTTQQGIFQQNLQNVLNPLMALSSQGENAAAQTGTLGNQAISGAAGSITGAGNALAAGQVGSAGALSGALGGLGNSATNFLLFNALNNGSLGGQTTGLGGANDPTTVG
jgi:hypothetical protein